jgi:hypothetical protein
VVDADRRPGVARKFDNCGVGSLDRDILGIGPSFAAWPAILSAVVKVLGEPPCLGTSRSGTTR